MEENELSKLLDSILIISLPKDEGRYNHSVNELEGLGFDLSKIKKIDGVEPKSDRVKKSYKDKRVGQHKRLTPERVGNWLAHIDAWRYVKNNDFNFVLILEDDISTIDNRINIIENNKDVLSNLKQKTDKELIIKLNTRCFIKNGKKNKKEGIFKFKNINKEKKMNLVSNAAYVINSKFAQKLLNNCNKIHNTSDVFVDNMSRKTQDSYYCIPSLFGHLSNTKDWESRTKPRNGNIKRFDKKK